MAEAQAAPGEFGPGKMMLSAELLQVLTAGDAARLEERLRSEGQANGHVAINLEAATPPTLAPLGPVVTSSCLLGVTSNGNTAMHLVASRGHAEVARLICERVPSLVATRNGRRDTPLHCASRGGHREVAACLLSTMRAGGPEEAAALRAKNCTGHTALHEAIRHGYEGVVALLMAEAPELASVKSKDGVSPLYLAVTTKSVPMVRLLLRPLADGTPSPASSAGRNGRTPLHVAATISKEMVQTILAWEPEGPSMLTKVNSGGRNPFSFAVRANRLDVVELLLSCYSHLDLAHISDYNGLFPLHDAVIARSTAMIDALIKRCPDYYEMVDKIGRNLLHFAVEKDSDTVVRYICQNDRFAMLLNATDFRGNTPLHLAVDYGYTRIVSILLQSTGVEININNRDGLTALDLADLAYPWGRLSYFLEPAVVVYYCLCWAGADGSLDILDAFKKRVRKEAEEKDYTKGTIASALIASVTFAAAFTVPGGLVPDDHLHPGTAILTRRFAFGAFVVSDAVAFLCSITATGFLIYGGVSEIPSNIREQYTKTSAMLVPLAARFMIAAFAFALHLVLGVANRGLIIFVYMVSSASIIYITPDVLAILHLLGYGKAIWRRAGWRGLLNIRKRPSGLTQLFRSLSNGLLVTFLLNVPMLLVLMLFATFVVAICLEIALPNY